MLIPLNTHSAYSLQEGTALPSELVQAAAAEGRSALALTDHRLLTGSIEFVIACKQAGIQPILGLEIDLPGGRLPLLATSQQGWANLCRLSSAIAMQAEPEAACSFAQLAENSDDLIALCSETFEEETLQQLMAIYPDRCYLMLQNIRRALATAALGRRLKLPLVVAQPIYTLNPDQSALQHTLNAIRLNQPISQLPAYTPSPIEACFNGSKKLESQFRNFPAAIAATSEIAARCKFDLPIGVARMPAVPLPAGQTATQVLRLKAEEGVRNIYGRITPPIQARLDHELEVIANMGFEPIFLIVEDLLNFARQTGVPFSSRGSAASSLVAHCLGITSPDPLRLNLYFERFLNPARTTPPDIDTDLCSERRDSVIQHVFDTYGHDRVAMVATINHFRPRSALGDVAKAYGMDTRQIREMVNRLPYAFWARKEETEEGQVPASPFKELRDFYTSPKEQLILNDAEALLKLPRHLSVHPGGVIVSPGPLTDLVPVMNSGSKGIRITQFDLESVEALGLVKIDLLGIRGLTVLGDVAGFIQASQPQALANSLSVLDSTPLIDLPTSNQVETGQTIGCFQIESPGMRSTLREIHARTPDDIMAALALYRPGPLTGGLKDAFVRRFKGEEIVHHIHTSLAPLLDETFGVILYQEQVLRIAHELAGFSLAEADLLRRAMSHFDPGKRMQELHHKFVSEAQSRSAVPLETGEQIWEMMAAFAGYGFPKAHAASYAQVAWRSAWCKTHFPAEFMAAVLANWGGYYSQRVYLGEARRIGLAVHPPHVNYSMRNFSVCEINGQKALYMGLDQVKGLTRRTIETIHHQRPFTSAEDFLVRVNLRPQEAVNLTRVGAFEGLGNIPMLLQRIQNGSWRPGQLSLFSWGDSIQEDWTLEQKAAAQQEILGVNLAANPLELAADKIAASGAISLLDASSQVGKAVTVAGVRQTSHRSLTAKGEAMLFLTLEDLTATMDVILFPRVYHLARAFIHGTAPVIIKGVVEMDASRGEPYLRAEQVTAAGL